MKTGSEAIRLALELSEELRLAKLRKLRRDFPAESDQEIRLRLQTWWLSRPDAPHGDASGPGFRLRVNP